MIDNQNQRFGFLHGFPLINSTGSIFTVIPKPLKLISTLSRPIISRAAFAPFDPPGS